MRSCKTHLIRAVSTQGDAARAALLAGDAQDVERLHFSTLQFDCVRLFHVSFPHDHTVRSRKTHLTRTVSEQAHLTRTVSAQGDAARAAVLAGDAQDGERLRGRQLRAERPPLAPADPVTPGMCPSRATLRSTLRSKI